MVYNTVRLFIMILLDAVNRLAKFGWNQYSALRSRSSLPLFV